MKYQTSYTQQKSQKDYLINTLNTHAYRTVQTKCRENREEKQRKGGRERESIKRCGIVFDLSLRAAQSEWIEKGG